MVPSIPRTRCTSAPAPTAPSSTSSTPPTGKRGPSEGGCPPASAARGRRPGIGTPALGEAPSGCRRCLPALGGRQARGLACAPRDAVPWGSSPARARFSGTQYVTCGYVPSRCAFFPCHPGLAVFSPKLLAREGSLRVPRTPRLTCPEGTRDAAAERRFLMWGVSEIPGLDWVRLLRVSDRFPGRVNVSCLASVYFWVVGNLQNNRYFLNFGLKTRTSSTRNQGKN